MRCKRRPFGLQKTAFRNAIHGLSHCKRRPFRVHPQFRCIMYRCQSRPRRGRTMLNRMCSEAELAVGMQPIISSSKRANCILGLCGLEVLRLYGMTVKPHNLTTVKPHNRKRCSPPSGTGGLVLTCRKFRSLRSLHMRLSIVRPLRGRDWHLYVIHLNCG